MQNLFTPASFLAIGAILLLAAFQPDGVGPEGLDPRAGLADRLQQVASSLRDNPTAAETARLVRARQELESRLRTAEHLTLGLALAGLASLLTAGGLYLQKKRRESNAH